MTEQIETKLFGMIGIGVRSHRWKLKTQMSHINVRNYLFSLGGKNKLDKVLEANSLHSVKSGYDKTHKIKNQ